ncbi:Uncharacterized protein GNX_0682 [Leptospira interrogans serovar Canicola]|nr:Uncharacterized protein GNX_0682 [Leptospira interrogans serovar Canicola]
MYNILIVEDIHSIREAIKDLLSVKYNIFDAENYDGAVDILKSEKNSSGHHRYSYAG